MKQTHLLPHPILAHSLANMLCFLPSILLLYVYDRV